MSSPVLSVTDIKKRFGELEVLHGLSLDAHPGDVISLIGSSGSGKSTFLRCINLLEVPESGDISLSGDSIRFKPEGQTGRVPADPQQVQQLRSRIGMVFQQFNLWSHMTILQNVMEAPVRVQGVAKAEAKELALEFLDKVGIANKRDAYPAFLSGGQQQRVGIARSLAVEPELWFLDEPFSALDPLIRREMQDEFLRLQSMLHKTIVFITHDFDEAIRLADRIAIMKDGEIIQIATPEELVMNPATDYVGEFTKHIPRAKVLTVGSVMSKEIIEGTDTVSVSARIEEIADKVESAGKPMSVVDADGKPVGSIRASTIIDVLVGRKVIS